MCIRDSSKSKENLDGISVGAFEAALFCAAYHPGKNKPLNVLDLPFLPLTSLDVMIKVHNAVYNHPSAKKALAKWNAHLYMPNVLPQYEYMGKGTPPAKVSDFKGKRLRALGGMGRAAKAIGAVPTTMPASETYTALSRGTVDAIGFPFTYTFSAYKLDEVSDWYTTNMVLGTVNCPVVFNVNSWSKLPKQYQKLFDMEDVELTFAEDALSAIARKAIARKTGARGLRSILEEVMLDVMYDLPSRENIRECIISEEVVERKQDPMLVYESEAEWA